MGGMSFSLPKPKELLKSFAEFNESMMELALKPIKDFAESVGLPFIEPPKASELIEALPDLPTPDEVLGELPFPGKAEGGEVKKMKVEKSALVKKEEVKLRIV